MGCGASSLSTAPMMEGKKLASHLSKIREEYDVVVIGSGYGGSVAACRAAQLGLSVCLLEKGKEWPVGTFPETPIAALKELQIHGKHTLLDKLSCDKTAKNSLYNISVNDDIMVFGGCGLGGGSLINAGVCMLPREEIFLQEEWPLEFRLEWIKTKFSQDVKNATEMLRPQTFPSAVDPLTSSPTISPTILYTDSKRKIKSSPTADQPTSSPTISSTYPKGKVKFSPTSGSPPISSTNTKTETKFSSPFINAFIASPIDLKMETKISHPPTMSSPELKSEKKFCHSLDNLPNILEQTKFSHLPVVLSTESEIGKKSSVLSSVPLTDPRVETKSSCSPVTLPKVKIFEKLADKLTDIEDIGKKPKFSLLPITVNFEERKDQRACTNCGNCVSGCNVGAKNTLYRTYLSEAVKFGAELFTDVEALYFIKNKDQDSWIVRYRPIGSKEDDGEGSLTVKAKYLFLGAGALGSTELLLRSKNFGKVSLSDKLGHGFSGNGDAIAFCFDGKMPSYSIGQEAGASKKVSLQPGPCITSGLNFREHKKISSDFILEDCALPHALSLAFKTMLSLSIPSPLPLADERSVQHTSPFLIMSHDSSGGVITLDSQGTVGKDGKAKIDWPRVGKEENFKRVNEEVKRACDILGGTYVADPLWSELFGKKLITVHPLGGAIMGQDKFRGVVNHACQVFRGDEKSTDVYENLLVVDAAVIPRSLAINPLMTITVVAERAMRLFAERLSRDG